MQLVNYQRKFCDDHETQRPTSIWFTAGSFPVAFISSRCLTPLFAGASELHTELPLCKRTNWKRQFREAFWQPVILQELSTRFDGAEGRHWARV